MALYKKGVAGTLKPNDFELIIESIISHSKDGLFVVDREGEVVMVNQATEEMFGFTAPEVLGRNVRELVEEGFYQPSVSLQVIEQKKILSLIQTTRYQKKILSTGVPIFDDNDQIKFVLVNDRDITHINMLAKSLYPDELTESSLRLDFSDVDLASTELEKMVVESPAMVKVVQLAIQVSKFDVPVSITGETGVGKTLVARLIHQLSGRRSFPFVDLNCAALSPTLIESELFGHESGAFTGASSSGKQGLFEVADKGTLFLDEIGEIPLSIQVKLLKFLEKMELTRVGGTRPVKINTRIIVATNQDLEQMVADGRFRRDLYFRLNVVPIQIPPLSERREDILPLAEMFLDRFNREFKTEKRLNGTVAGILPRYPYPGNVRELENLIRRMAAISQDDDIDIGLLPPMPGIKTDTDRSFKKPEQQYQSEMGRLEYRILREAVAEHGSQRKAAAALGISQSTLSRKLKKAASSLN